MRPRYSLTFPRKWTLVGAALVFASRLSILPANFSPLGSYGFFGANSWLYFLTIVAFDTWVGGYYPGWLFTYLGFSAYPLLGMVARRIEGSVREGGGQRLGAEPSRLNQWLRRLIIPVLLLPLASFVFFLISNLGVWWYWYPRTWTGLMMCYTLALPFYQRTLIGDLSFGYAWTAGRLIWQTTWQPFYGQQFHRQLAQSAVRPTSLAAAWAAWTKAVKSSAV